MPSKSGSKWYNNGKVNKLILPGEEVPEGFVLGMARKSTSKGTVFYHKGTHEIRLKPGEEVPEGYIKGRVPYSDSRKRDIVRKRENTCLNRYGVSIPSKLKVFQDKAKETCLERYGVESPTQLDEVQEKVRNTTLERYGVPYFLQNPDCCRKVMGSLKKTNLQRYGVENVFLLSEFQDKAKNTRKNRYGVEYPLQSDISKGKFKETCLERYGVENPLQSDEIQSKVKQTTLEKYGVENVFQSDDIKGKIKETNMNKYGAEWFTQTNEFKDKSSNTKIDRYGTDNTSSLSWVQDKAHKTCMKRYGVPNPLLSEEIKSKVRKTNIERYGVPYPSQNDKVKQKISDTCRKHFGVPWPCMTEQYLCSGSNQSHSKPNERFAKLLGMYGVDFSREFPLNTYLYDFKVGDTLVEIDPTVTHNSHTNPYTYFQGKSTHYHYYKSETAKDSGFFCIHIFDWDNVVQIVTQLILSSTYSGSGTIQCSCNNGSISLGILDDCSLVGSVSFSLEGKNTYRVDGSTLGVHKQGFFRIIFDKFVCLYRPDKILVEVDNSKVGGKYLLDSGFKVVSETGPVCHWYNTSSGEHYNSHTDDVPYDYDTMISNGFLPVYDCGYTTYEWTKPELSKSKIELKLISKI